jgi:hypothetical protein
VEQDRIAIAAAAAAVMPYRLRFSKYTKWLDKQGRAVSLYGKYGNPLKRKCE